MPNNSFKPNLLRYGNGVAEEACHAVACTAQVGLTRALGPRSFSIEESEMLQIIGLVVSVTGLIAMIRYGFTSSNSTFGLAGATIFAIGLVLLLLHRHRTQRIRSDQDGPQTGA